MKSRFTRGTATAVTFALALAMAGALETSSPATAAERFKPSPLQVIKAHDLSPSDTRPGRKHAPDASVDDVRLPEAGKFKLDRSGPGEWLESSQAPVAVGFGSRDAKTRKLQSGALPAVEVWGQALTRKVVPLGYVVSFSDPDLRSVRLSYAGLEGAGGDVASRMQLVQFPDCVLQTPDDADCSRPTVLRSSRDGAAKTLTATPDARISTESGTTVMALATSDEGSNGDWKATSLTPSSTWESGGPSGAFSWNYPLRTPPVAAGTKPDLAISYSSGSVDGRSVSQNNQTSWIGEGFDLNPGFIERTYRTCSDDMRASSNNKSKTGDLCWAGDNMSVSFGGFSGEMVRTTSGGPETAGTWRIRQDNGAKLERKTTGGFNADNNGEYWIMTMPDGTRAFFGQGRTVSGGAALNSAWTVPVFGNDDTEPCYNAVYASASCTQVWRWNLDRVIDPQGNSTVYTYVTETNKYGRNMNKSAVSYVRGGYLTSIAYGLRSASESATPPAKVLFTVAERCKPTASFDCAEAKLTSTNAAKWPDVPFDKICGAAATTCPNNFSPTFFTRKRLTTVTTQAYSGAAHVNVDSWTLDQSFPDPEDTSSPSLWLSSIQQKGHVGTAITLPKTEFFDTNMANRVDGVGDFAPPFHKRRVQQIITESGASITVDYSAMECTPSNIPASQPNNAKLCYPQKFTPTGFTDPTTHWFHKYVVEGVTVVDQSNSGSPNMETRYVYLGSPAWAYNDSPGLKNKDRTWSQWRGFGRLRTIEGGADVAKGVTEETFFRGMDGDKAVNDDNDDTVKDIDVTDSNGEEVPDHWRLSGQTREIETFVAVGGTRLDSEITSYETPDVAAVGNRGVAQSQATKVDTRSFIDGGHRFQSTVNRTYDTQGYVATSDEHTRRIAASGTVSQQEHSCTTTTYARNTSLWIMDKVETEKTVALACGDPNGLADLVSSTRTSYDQQAFGAAPAKGNPTHVEVLVTDGITQRWVSKERRTYDNYGRVTETKDANSKATNTAFAAPAIAGGAPGTVTITSPDPDDTGPLTPHVETRTMDVRLGKPTRVQKPNTLYTDATYDALGRLLKVWEPGRNKATDVPNIEYSYKLSTDGNNAVTTKTLLPSGGTRTSVQLLDGLLRERQRQIQTETNDGTGNPVAATYIDDTVFDSRGRTAYRRPYVLATGLPSTQIQYVNNTAISNEMRTLYDAAGQITAQILMGRNAGTGNQFQEISRTTSSYTGETSTSVPPSGGVITASTNDARGRTIHKSRFPAGLGGAAVTYDYDYDRFGTLSTVSDPAGNEWRYTHDSVGNRLRTEDPDAGVSESTYDDLGQLTKSVQDPGGEAVTKTFTYDNLARRTGEYLGEGAAREQFFGWEFDDATRGKGMPFKTTVFKDGALLYTETVSAYDLGGRPSSSSVKFNAVSGLVPSSLAGNYAMTRTYFANGAAKSVSTPNLGDLPAEVVDSTYDTLGRPDSLGGWGSYVRSTDYLPFGHVSRVTLGNASGKTLWVDSWYDQASYHVDKVLVDGETTAGVDSTRTFGYDEVGNPTRIEDQSTAGTDTQCFARDGLGQLTKAWTPGGGVCSESTFDTVGLGGPDPYRLAWTYDNATGNRLTQTDSTNPAELVSDVYDYAAAGQAGPHATVGVTRSQGLSQSTTAYTYDARGNVEQRGDQVLSWDANNHLAEVSMPGDAATQTQVSDSEGRRLLRVVDGTTTVYLPDGTEASAAADGTGTADATRYYAFSGGTVAVRTGASNGSVTSLALDAHGTPAYAFANSTGVLTPRRETPFGQQRGSSSIPGSRVFVGGTEDEASGLVQVGARPYDPVEGRFLGVDPVIDASDPRQVSAAYAYGKNDPLTYADPTGKMPPPDFGYYPPYKPPTPSPSPTSAPSSTSSDDDHISVAYGKSFLQGSFLGNLWTNLIRAQTRALVKKYDPIVRDAGRNNKKISGPAREQLGLVKRDAKAAAELKEWRARLDDLKRLDTVLKHAGPAGDFVFGLMDYHDRREDGQSRLRAGGTVLASAGAGVVVAYAVGAACGPGILVCGTVALGAGATASFVIERALDGKLDDDVRASVEEQKKSFMGGVWCHMSLGRGCG